MNDRVNTTQDQVVKDFIASIGRALAGLSGDVDQVCDTFSEAHSRHVAQAVLQLMHHTDTLRQQTAQKELAKMRKESGFYG